MKLVFRIIGWLKGAKKFVAILEASGRVLEFAREEFERALEPYKQDQATMEVESKEVESE